MWSYDERKAGKSRLGWREPNRLNISFAGRKPRSIPGTTWYSVHCQERTPSTELGAAPSTAGAPNGHQTKPHTKSQSSEQETSVHAKWGQRGTACGVDMGLGHLRMPECEWAVGWQGVRENRDFGMVVELFLPA